MRKRWLAILAILLPAIVMGVSRQDPAWAAYQQRFVSADGRVIDSFNGAISHSEGQGYGLLLAVNYRDRDSFERIWAWTRKNLQVRDDALLAWKWEPQAGKATDLNNATDGDLLVAWALLRAAKLWQVPQWRDEAVKLLQTVRKQLLRDTVFGPALLPGMVGFEAADSLTLNLSYWVFPAFADFAEADGAQWRQVGQTGFTLLEKARFGRWKLPPDWLKLSGDKLEVQQSLDRRYGYNALRIPLYLVWAGQRDARYLEPFLNFWSWFDGARFVPAWTDLGNDSVDGWNAPPGIRATMALARRKALPTENDDHYYPATLGLLSRMAQKETTR